MKTKPIDRPGNITLPGLVDRYDLATDRDFSMSLARGLEVLRAFTPQSPSLGNGEIARRTGLPKATVSRLTYTLTLLGYLHRNTAAQKYSLAGGVLSLANPLLASLALRQRAKPLMESIAQKTGCTVNLGMRDRGFVVYVDSVRADVSNPHLPDIGTTRPLMASAIGRALILLCPAAERTAILNYVKLQDPEGYVRLKPAFDEDSKRFAERGFCHSRGDWRPEFHAVAVALKRVPGRPDLGLNCTLSTHLSGNDKLLREAVPRLKEAARALEAIESKLAHPTPE